MDRFYQLPLPGKILTVLGTYTAVAAAVRLTKKVYTSLFSDITSTHPPEEIRDMLREMAMCWNRMIQTARTHRDPNQQHQIMQQAFNISLDNESKILAAHNMSVTTFRNLIAQYRQTDKVIDQTMKGIEAIFSQLLRPNTDEDESINTAVQTCLKITNDLYTMYYNMNAAAAQAIAKRHGLKIGRDPIPADVALEIDNEVARTYVIARTKVLAQAGMSLEEFSNFSQIAEQGSPEYRKIVAQIKDTHTRRWQSFLSADTSASRTSSELPRLQGSLSASSQASTASASSQTAGVLVPSAQTQSQPQAESEAEASSTAANAENSATSATAVENPTTTASVETANPTHSAPTETEVETQAEPSSHVETSAEAAPVAADMDVDASAAMDVDEDNGNA